MYIYIYIIYVRAIYCCYLWSKNGVTHLKKKQNKTHERAPGFPATMAMGQGQQYPAARTPSPHLPNSMVSVVEDPIES